MWCRKSSRGACWSGMKSRSGHDMGSARPHCTSRNSMLQLRARPPDTPDPRSRRGLTPSPLNSSRLRAIHTYEPAMYTCSSHGGDVGLCCTLPNTGKIENRAGPTGTRLRVHVQLQDLASQQKHFPACLPAVPVLIALQQPAWPIHFLSSTPARRQRSAKDGRERLAQESGELPACSLHRRLDP